MFGALAGILGAFAPNIFSGVGKWFEARQELERLKEMNKNRLEISKQRGETDVQIGEISRRQQVSSDSGALLKAAYKHDTAQSNGMVEMLDVCSEHCSKWAVNLIALLFAVTMAIRAKVRPVLAFGSAFIWAHAEWYATVKLSPAGEELVAAVITFYFTDRAKNAWREYGVSEKISGKLKRPQVPSAQIQASKPVEEMTEQERKEHERDMR